MPNKSFTAGPKNIETSGWCFGVLRGGGGLGWQAGAGRGGAREGVGSQTLVISVSPTPSKLADIGLLHNHWSSREDQ